MIYDPSRDLTIAYNYLNLPHTFTQGDGSTITHLYTANGTKLRETTTDQNGTPVNQRDYLGPVIYKDGVPQSIQHADGRVVPGGACANALHVGGGVAGAETYAGGRITTDATVLPTGRLDLKASGEIRLEPGFEVQRGGYLLAETVGCPLPAVGQWQFEYFLTDHLGNNRVLFADSDGDGSIDPAAEVVQENHYYAFGLGMEGAWTEPIATANQNRFKYNGKELNEEVGLYDYGARWYDPAIGRWSSIDAKAAKYAPYSPYNYTLNNPIMFVDPDGNEVIAPNEASRQLVLNSVQYMFGKNHGFSFDGNRLVSGGSMPEGLSSGQTAMYNMFIDGLVNSDTRTTVRANRSNDIVVRGDDISVLSVGEASATTFSLNETTKQAGGDNGISVSFSSENIILVPSETISGGGSVMTQGGGRSVGADHATSHELGHAIVNSVMAEFDGVLGGINFNEMTKEERSDWAIRFTNSLFGKNSSRAETGEGQHGRDDKTRPSSSLDPIN